MSESKSIYARYTNPESLSSQSRGMGVKEKETEVMYKELCDLAKGSLVGFEVFTPKQRLLIEWLRKHVAD